VATTAAKTMTEEQDRQQAAGDDTAHEKGDARCRQEDRP